MATLVQSKTIITAADKTLQVVMDSAITSGNTLIACCTAAAATNPTTFAVATAAASTNFTVAITETPDADFGACASILYRIADGTESQTINLTVTATNTPDCALWVGEYSGLAASSVLDKFAAIAMTGGSDFRTSQSTGTTSGLAQANELAVALWSTHQATSGDGYSGSFSEVLKQSVASYGQMNIATLDTSSTSGLSCTRTWSSPSTLCTGVIATFKETSGSSPTNTMPGSGLQMTSAATTAISGISVAEGSSPVSSIRVYCTSGDLTVTLSGSVVISAGSNGSSDLTLGSGASITEYNTVLGTLVYQGDTSFNGKDTINVVSSDGTLSDTDSFYVLNDPLTLTVTVTGTYAQGVAAIESLRGNLFSGTSGSIEMVSMDATAATDTDTISLVGTGVPAAPTNLQVSRVASGTVTATWVNGSDNGSVQTDSHLEYRTPAGSGSWTRSSTGIISITHTVTGLTDGLEYEFQVITENAVGESSPSTSATITLDASVPSAPTGLTLRRSGSGVVLAFWVNGDDGGSTQTDTHVEYRTPAGSGSWTRISTGTISTSYQVGGLTEGATYEFQILAENAIGESAASTSKQVVVQSTTHALGSALLLYYDAEVVSPNGTVYRIQVDENGVLSTFNVTAFEQSRYGNTVAATALGKFQVVDSRFKRIGSAPSSGWARRSFRGGKA